MVVTVYARHSGKCPQIKVSCAGQFRRCKCPLWLRWGKCHKRSARTRTWEIATKAARGPGSERGIGEGPYSGYVLRSILARHIIRFAGLIPVFLDTGTEFVRLRFVVGSNLLRARSGFRSAQFFCG